MACKCIRKFAVLFTVVLALICTAAVTTNSGCVGKVTRDHVTVPIIESLWGPVKAEIMRGPTAPTEGLVEFDAAVGSGERVNIAAVAQFWPALRAVAEANINARTISDGVKASLIERVKNFSDSVAKAVERLN